MTNGQAVRVARHRTAMVRHSLSQPVSILVRFGVLRPGVTMFDYGCGQGDDLRALIAGGIEAAGWDPHFAPDNPRVPADVVNLGFVLNVIEDPAERLTALRSAWELTRTALAISTMIVGQVPVDGLRSYGDGFLTSRGTFQKYFQHAELRQLILRSLDVEPVAAAPGIFLAFRRDEDAEEFLLARRSSRRVSTAGFRSTRTDSRKRQARPELADRIRDQMEAIAAFMLHRGRAPQIDEVAPDVLERLAEEHVSLGRAIDACREHLVSDEALTSAQATRREDLVVHRALSLLNRSKVAPGSSIMRDVRTLFDNQTDLADQAKDYLFGLADETRMRKAIEDAAAHSLGLVDHRGRFVFDAALLNDLPGALRCYAGCATHLSGEPDGGCIYRLDPARRRASLMIMDDPREWLPTMSQEVRIDLKRQDVSIVARQRRLLRRADLQRLGARTKQRQEERKYRESAGLGPELIFQSIS